MLKMEEGHVNGNPRMRAATSKRSSPGEGNRPNTLKTVASIIWVPVIFLCASYGLYTLSVNFPLERGDTPLQFPTSLEELRGLAAMLERTQQRHLASVLTLFCLAYLYKQSFAIPGSVFMNLLAGALFGVVLGFPLACLLTATGATCCYLMSRFFGRPFLLRFFPDKVAFFQHKVEENADGLLYFLLFLRIFPMSPNWLMNMVAPVVGVPIHKFFISVFFGLMPYNFICVQTGCMLSEIRSVNDMFTLSRMLQLLLIAACALLPILLRRRSRLKAQ